MRFISGEGLSVSLQEIVNSPNIFRNRFKLLGLRQYIYIYIYNILKLTIYQVYVLNIYSINSS